MVENFYTDRDMLMAATYGMMKVREVRCRNDEIREKIPGIGWVPDKRMQSFECPVGLKDCSEAAGRCKFLTEDSCLSQSGDFKDQGQGKKPYLEWHPELAGAKTGEGDDIGKCVLGNFPLRSWCENPHSRRAGQFVPGVTNTPPFKYDQTDGLCKMTKPYCKYMGVGFTERNDDFYRETGLDLPDCHESGFQKFAEKFGKVLFRGFKRGLYQKFLLDIAKHEIWKPGPLFYYDVITGIAKGKYDEELGLNQDYSGIKEEFSQLTPENAREKIESLRNTMKEEMIKGISEIKLEKNTETSDKDISFVNLTVICDPKAIESKKIIGPNFGGPGVNLYLIIWNDEYNKKYSGNKIIQFGFICDELEKAGIPIVKKDGYKAAYLTKNNTEKSKGLRRVYITYAAPEWIYSFMGNALIDSGLINYTANKYASEKRNAS